tara:strand:- start:1351 stop:3177 length:1827 start_codon:yes stop_codon:yes gene_type:complete
MASLTPTFTGDLSTAITKRALSAYFDWEDRNYISQGKGASRVSGTDPMVGGGGSGGGGRGPINPDIVTRTPFDGLVRRPTINNTNPRSKAVVVQDRALGNFLVAVAISLNSSLNSLNEKSDATTEGIIVAKDGIDKTYKKLEQSSDSLETKLDAIIDALRYSNNQEKVLADERETKSQQAKQAAETDFSTANEILMQDMDREEIRQMQERDIAEDDRGPIVDTPPQNEDQLELPFAGEFAEGGIASGPDSGYLAVLHGDEAVIPLDNNFTQNQPSAIGKKPIATMPMMAERGTDNADSMRPSFTPNVTMASAPSISFGGGGSGMGEMLSKAIQLPAKAAGLVTMGLMNKVLRSGNISSVVAASLKSLSSPIASAFGIPDVLSADLAPEDDGREDYRSAGGGKRRREKGLFGRFKDFILGTGGSSYGRGGSSYGRGGSTTYNRMSVNGTGGYGYGGWPFGGKKDGKTIIDKMKYDPNHPDGTSQQNPHPPGSTLYNIFERHRQYDELDMLGSINSGDSQFFAKNVTYDNAYDYLNSPNYGLRTSEIAYNMSMQDEVTQISDSLANPESQVVMNNASVNKDGGDQQIEYSAIAVRGNPLKDGTYISPYSV